MGVILNDLNNNNNNNTAGNGDLYGWILKVKSKKSSFKRQRNSSLFIDAILANALRHAEHDLHEKQRMRKQKWQHLKTSNSCGGMMTATQVKSAINHNMIQVWDTRTCEDLNSLDNFMSLINNTKCSISTR